MSGTQALVRLPMLQKARDRRAGLNTAGYVPGYRGSPPSPSPSKSYLLPSSFDGYHLTNATAQR
jgi:hypothetical protein